jgi:hypothetical protein
MASRPQTLYGIADSPVGLAAWMLDHDARSYALIDGQTEGLTRDDILDNVTLYWLTNTAVSSARLYWENKLAFFDVKGIRIPVAVSAFPDELYQAQRNVRALRFLSAWSTFTAISSSSIGSMACRLSRWSFRSERRERRKRRSRRRIIEGALSSAVHPHSAAYQLRTGARPSGPAPGLAEDNALLGVRSGMHLGARLGRDATGMPCRRIGTAVDSGRVRCLLAQRIPDRFVAALLIGRRGRDAREQDCTGQK